MQNSFTIALVAPARYFEEKNLIKTQRKLESLGFLVLMAPSLLNRENQFIGSLNERVRSFQSVLDNNKVDVIWCLRGGYGCIHIIDKLDFSNAMEKLFIGFSDFTVFLNHLSNLNIRALHAPMPSSWEISDQDSFDQTITLLRDREGVIKWNTKCLEKVEFFLPVYGGNLSVYYSLLGSQSISKQLSHDHILLLEDLDEYTYHIDRMMNGLLRSGVLRHVKLILVGSFTSIHDHSIPFGLSPASSIRILARNLNIPCVFDAPFGHGNRNLPLVFGKSIKVSLANNQIIMNQFL